MEIILLALNAIRTLTQNPRLGGGGVKAAENVQLLGHLVQLIQGGSKTARALKEWAEQIHGMAEAGTQPSSRDFDLWTTRLNTALAVVAEAKAKVAARKPKPLETGPQEGGGGSLDPNVPPLQN